MTITPPMVYSDKATALILPMFEHFDLPENWIQAVTHIEHIRHAFSYNQTSGNDESITLLAKLCQDIQTATEVQFEDLGNFLGQAPQLCIAYYGRQLLDDMHAGAVYLALTQAPFTYTREQYREALPDIALLGYPLRILADSETSFRETARQIKLKHEMLTLTSHEETRTIFTTQIADLKEHIIEQAKSELDFVLDNNYRDNAYKPDKVADTVQFLVGPLDAGRRAEILYLFTAPQRPLRLPSPNNFPDNEIK